MTSFRLVLVAVFLLGVGAVVAGTPATVGSDLGAGGESSERPAQSLTTVEPTDVTGTPDSSPDGTPVNGTGTPTTETTPGVVGTCPSFRGVASLCEATRTPSPTPTPDEGSALGRPPTASTGVGRPEAARGDSFAGWLAGLAPLLLWGVAVTFVAPIVLGGLLGAISRRGGG